jgi:hypothetical protein
VIVAILRRGSINWRPNSHNSELLAQIRQVLGDYREQQPRPSKTKPADRRTQHGNRKPRPSSNPAK